MTVELICGDAREALAAMPEGSVDAIVTDPPYGLEFMGKEWDKLDAGIEPTRNSAGGAEDAPGIGNAFSRSRIRYGASAATMQAWHHAWAVAALRVLKPGGHLLAFGAPRTHHRLMCALEDAGFEIRDTLMWLYGSGFPKSLDVSKAIDKAAGAELVVGHKPDRWTGKGSSLNFATDRPQAECKVTAPTTDAVRQWEGWGTALKPAWEPIVLARKPLVGTVKANVQAHGTGALNIDGCRIPGSWKWGMQTDIRGGGYGSRRPSEGDVFARDLESDPAGRWPANLALDEDAAAMLDVQSGERKAGGKVQGTEPSHTGDNGIYGAWERVENSPYGDSGGASRFFYCAKASREEREAGVGGEEKPLRWSSGDKNPGSFQADGTKKAARNNHPTVKPVDLMRWLVRLVTPPGGLILDPFIGSGTTAAAAVLEGFRCIGIDNNAEYLATAQQRVERAIVEREHGKDGADAIEAGQLTLEAAR